MPLPVMWKGVLKSIRKNARKRLEKLRKKKSKLESKRERLTQDSNAKENVDAKREPMQRVVKNWKQDVFIRQVTPTEEVMEIPKSL